MATRWIFGSHLSHDLPIVKEADKETDVFLFVEAHSRSTWQNYHKQKLVLVFSAMRHFAEELKNKGYTVDYREAESFQEAWEKHAKQFSPKDVYMTEQTDYRMRVALSKWSASVEKDVNVHILSDNPLFLLPYNDAKDVLSGNGPWMMDPFYRMMRKKFSVLVEDNKPVGGKWSFDSENRKPPKSGVTFEKARDFRPDPITKAVISKVQQTYGENPGSLETFRWPVTRKEALAALNQFIGMRLPTFGTYQDAMLTEDVFMSHSLLSSSINIGLLTPLEVIEKAEQAYHDEKAPLHAVEGFIRQILGWREYMRAVYIRMMPEYRSVNTFDHKVDLPPFFWDAKSSMNCMQQSIQPVVDYGYNHHIQRLMVLGNFANLFGISPQQTADWFNELYIDAYDWVVLPNVLGMALYADGGRLSTKPYIASGNYINKMSDYCKGCKFHVKHQLEDDACPFNALYWNFVDCHEERLASNHRMGFMMKQWEKRAEEDKDAIRKKAASLKAQLASGAFHLDNKTTSYSD